MTRKGIKPPYRIASGLYYKIGENVSTRNLTRLTDLEKFTSNVYYGFHVYLNKKDIMNCYLYIPVKIYLDDIVAIGKFAGRDSLVCTKFTISKKDYNKVVKNRKDGHYGNY